MQLLPLEPANQLVTRTDMQSNTIMLRGEMGELRGEMAELRSELRGEMAELRADLTGQMVELRAELRGDMDRLHGSMQRMMAAALLANAVAIVTALLA